MESEHLELTLKRKLTKLESANVSRVCIKQRRRLAYVAKMSDPVNATLVTRTMCLLLMIMNRFETVVARIWLKRQYIDTESHRSYTDEDRGRLIEKWFMEADAMDVLNLPDYNSSKGLAQYRKAAQFTAEYKTEQWVFECNQNKGVAPTSDHVVSRYEIERRGVFLSLLDGLHGPPNEPDEICRRRSWAVRFRARWGSKYGSMGVREEYTMEQLRGKAWSPTLVAFSVPYKGPEKWF
jgi:hypothetical protein